MRQGWVVIGVLLFLIGLAQSPYAAHTINLPLVMSPMQGGATPTATRAACDPAYPDVCIPPPPPDLDCTQITFRNFAVLPPDPHDFDADNDGIGCEDLASPTSTATATSTSTPTSTPTQQVMTVTYRVTGTASQVSLSYLSASGQDIDLQTALPWTLEFTTSALTDLSLEARSATTEHLELSCEIAINGTLVTYDQTTDSAQGVFCERFLP
jgi:hypothetical protein